MQHQRTPMSQSTVDPKFVTYVWTVSVNGSLYVKNGMTPVKVGKIVGVSWTKKYKCSQLSKNVPAFKVLVDTSMSAFSQDVDSSMEMRQPETFVIQENLYRGGTSFNVTGAPTQIRINTQLEVAYQNGPQGKQGLWFKNWFNSEMAQTDNEGNSIASTTMANVNPTAFGPPTAPDDGIHTVMFIVFRIVVHSYTDDEL